MTARFGHLRLAVGAGVLTTACLIAGATGIRINTSSSLPLGLYVRTSDVSADLVEFCPAEPFAGVSRQRGYRMRGFACPDGAVPLLKPVVARAGDLVEVSAAGLAVNGTLLPNTAALKRDAARRPLSAWPTGQYIVQPGTIWVASTYGRGSYDSRYIGPVKESDIRGRLKALWLLRG